MNKSKKILLISHEMTYSGAPRSLLNIAMLLKKNNFYVEVWTLLNGSFIDEYKKRGIHTKIIDKNIDKYSNEIRTYDVVILNTFFTAYLEPVVKRYVRTILYIREAHNISEIAKNCFLDENNIKNASEIVCVSEYAKDFITKTYNPQSVKVIHNYIEDVYKGQINIVKGGKINFLISGTYEERKGHDIAVEAFKKMPEELKKITTLHIVGRKPEWAREYWESISKKYDNRIIEYGEITDREKLMELYKKMNVFIVPSRDESCSLVALEGAMLGKVVLMSNNVGAKYLDENGMCVYETLNSDELCRKMCQFTSRKKLIIYGMKMRKSYKKTSTEKIFVEKFLRLIMEEL